MKKAKELFLKYTKEIVISVVMALVTGFIISQITGIIHPSYKVGDIVKFGSYEQDNNLSNGAEKIEWIVLDALDGKYLLLSRQVLDAHAYNDVEKAVSWETCTLRKWLNEDFLATAFTDREQKKIPTVTNENPDNEEFGIAGGNVTRDQVFLLSYPEAKKYLNLENGYGISTDYAVAQGAITYDSFKEVPVDDPMIMENMLEIYEASFDPSKLSQGETGAVASDSAPETAAQPETAALPEGESAGDDSGKSILYFIETRNCSWYLRSPGYRQDAAAMVRNYHLSQVFSEVSELLDNGGSLVDNVLIGIRPCIWYEP